MKTIKELIEDQKTINANVEKVFEAGKSAGGGGYEQGFEDGKNSVDDMLKYANTVNFANLNVFGKKEVELNLDNATTLNRLFYVVNSANKNTTVEHLTINCLKKPTNMAEMIYSNGSSSNDNMLKRLTLNVDTSRCTTFADFLSGRVGLLTLDGKPLDFSACTSSTIKGFPSYIEEFRVVKETISKNFSVPTCYYLSAETTQSLIDGLADLTGQTSQTLTLHPTVYQSLTSEQMLQIMNKNWIPQ